MEKKAQTTLITSGMAMALAWISLATGCVATPAVAPHAEKPTLVIVVGTDRPAADLQAVSAYLADVKTRSSQPSQIIGASEFTTNPRKGSQVLIVGTANSNTLIEKWLETDLPVDGYALDIQPDLTRPSYVAGQSLSGLMAGLGQLLRTMDFSEGGAQLPTLSERDFPRLSVRGMYIASHFHNYYEEASAEEINRLVADMALWGCNDLSFNYPSHQSAKLSDYSSQKMLKLLNRINTAAHNLGVRTTLLQNPLFIRSNTPAELRGTAIPGVWHKGYEVCPSIPAGLEMIHQGAEEIVAQFDHLDALITWPYDGGGCGCSECQPWGGTGFIKASKAFADAFHARFPEGKVILSTWWFDRPAIPALRDDFKSLLHYLETENPEWIDGFLTGANKHIMQAPLLDRPNPEKYPLTCFPEISMYKMKPWGGFGANPVPMFNEEYAKAIEGLVEGGWPYSEGIYDDINKFYWIRYFWNPEQLMDEILTDYAAYYLSPEVAPDAVRLFYLFENTMPQSGWSFGEDADIQEAWALVQHIDARLPEWSRKSWRWRLLFIRAGIANLMLEQGLDNPETIKSLEEYRQEICTIYHVTKSTALNLAGFVLPKTGTPGNLAFGLNAEVSSTHHVLHAQAAKALTDGVILNQDNVWLHDHTKDPVAQITFDLKKKCDITAVRLFCHGQARHYRHVPRSVTVEVSQDGVLFTPVQIFPREAPDGVALFQDFPAEGSPTKKGAAEFDLKTQAQYIRLIFGGSKIVGFGEIEIIGSSL